ncbi:peptidase family M1-domain-containing protein [Pilobolus umbonatus]|nr:peptidase family M1-domain-containing protein [Pilobolus umbonatus]
MVDSKVDSKVDSQPDKSFWSRYGLWIILPLMLAVYYSSHQVTVSAIIKEGRQILPNHVHPTHYHLELAPHLDTFDFDGTVKINLYVNNETSNITLNALEITFESVVMIVDKTNRHTATDIQLDHTLDRVTFVFDTVFKKESQPELHIHYKGILNDQMVGFYRSSYTDTAGDIKYLATTQFEAADARRAFPCWDEPAIKSTFDVTLTVPKDLTALSNMNIVSEHTNTDTKTVSYATTPMMSTYLLAFVVGPFEYIESMTSGEHNGKPIRTRVYTLPGLVEQGRHALDVATETLEYFAKVFNEPYPLPKMDLVAIPDFDAGAMENWGLVTYRTTALLYDPVQSTFANKRSVAYTVCHELAHQWFGNLVTLEWWDYLWLNEGFATWVGWYAVDHLFPEWEIWTLFVQQSMQRALELDSLLSSHPVEVAVNSPDEIHQIFDAISYEKGGSVIRMLFSWLGPDAFLSGVSYYLTEHKFGNTVSSDLWDALSVKGGENVSELTNTWILKTGYPVVKVQLEGPSQIRVTQSRYLSTGHNKDDTVWWVPLRIQVPGKLEMITIKNESQLIQVPEQVPIKLNQDQASLFRVSYSTELLNRLVLELGTKEGILSNTNDRIGILSDLSALTMSGDTFAIDLLNFINAFKNESNYFVLSEISTDLNRVIVPFEQYDTVLSSLQSMRDRIFTPIFTQLGWHRDNESFFDSQLRILAILQSGKSGNPTTVSECKSRFKAFINGDRDQIPADLRSAVYLTVLKYAHDEEEEENVWNSVFKIYQSSDFPMDQRVSALSCLGYYIKSEKLIKKTMDLIFDTQRVKTQDSWYITKALGTNIHARTLLIDFFMVHYDQFYSKYVNSMGALSNSVSALISDITDQDQLDQLHQFFKTKDTTNYERGLNLAVEHAKINIAFIQREHKALYKWAKANQ